MTDKDSNQLPRLKIERITLQHVFYRIGKTSSTEWEPSEQLSGGMTYSFSKKTKTSFTMRSTHEIKVREIVFRARHETQFTSDTPIPRRLFVDDSFQRKTLNMVLPFGCELFANLTSKSLAGPIIAPSELPPQEPTVEDKDA